MATITTPIWRDCYVDLLSSSSIPFRIRANSSSGDIIYTGLCSPRPGALDCVVRINDIAADYLTHTVPALSSAAFSALSFPVKFYVEKWNGASWLFTSDDYAFLLNWSYDPLYTIGTTLSAPIDGRLSPGQYVLVTVYNVASITAVFTYDDGTSTTQTISLSISPDFNADYNHDFARSLRSAGSGTVAFALSDYAVAGKKMTSVTINGETFDVANGCDDRYVLYYLNAYGGWDSLLVSGNSVRTDGLGRNTSETDYDNRGVQNRGRKDYAIDITRKYTIRTGLLSDDAASRMWHLLESTDVYLHDLVTDEVRPVVLTDSEAAFQSFRGNGGRMPQYTIAAEVAQVFERR